MQLGDIFHQQNLGYRTCLLTSTLGSSPSVTMWPWAPALWWTRRAFRGWGNESNHLKSVGPGSPRKKTALSFNDMTLRFSTVRIVHVDKPDL